MSAWLVAIFLAVVLRAIWQLMNDDDNNIKPS